MEQNKNLTEEDLCNELQRQFAELRNGRKKLERTWQLNVNFVNGDQYCRITDSGDISPVEREYGWEQRRVFNHVAPIIDTRLSKLSRIRPALSVRPASEEQTDMNAARLSSAILSALQQEGDLDAVISQATMWSEICGTSFYKIIWQGEAGRVIGITEEGKKLREGKVNVAAVSPFEIYPFSLSVENLEGQQGLIHARLVPVQQVFNAYGVKCEGKPISEFPPALCGVECNSAENSGEENNFVLLLERYVRPSKTYPEGRLTVTAGDKLLYNGELPYVNGDNGTRDFPFVMQTSVPVPGSFFGRSVVERLIPVQRAFNAVKNRKHEYLNRISMGCVAVEDGSVDVDELTEEGLAPGKVIVYRQGGNPPEMLTLGNVPEEFWKEEESLLTEFTKISGTGELSDNADSFAGITSATGLQLIIEQDDARLNVAYQSVKRALKAIGRQVLRLYKQFASEIRLLRYAGADGKSNLVSFKGSDISSDDVVLDADTDMNMTPAQKRTVIFELMEKGLFSDGEGKMTQSAKKRVLELLGYSSLEDVIPGD